MPKQGSTDQQLSLRVVLIRPPAGVDYGLQEGKGADYRTAQRQRGDGRDLSLECSVMVTSKDGEPRLSGPFVQGPAAARFLYVDVGQMAGQADCCWSRRIKIPLKGITGALLKKAIVSRNCVLEAKVQGTGKDGGPACATVPLLNDWCMVRKR